MIFRWRRSTDPQAALRELVGDYELPSFSGVAMETLRLLREDADLAQVASRIMVDPGLSVRILKTVNSAAFGMRQPVSNLQHATSLLGRSKIEALVLTAAVGGALTSAPGIDLNRFWGTSAQRACVARRLAGKVDPGSEIESFTAGLLQDMAIPVLASGHPDRYPAICQQAERDATTSLHELEQDALGYDHAQVGAIMAEAWDLPEALISAISGHHGAGDSTPAAVEAVARIRHADPPDSLESLRMHCAERHQLDGGVLDPLIASAVAESVSLAESMVSRS